MQPCFPTVFPDPQFATRALINEFKKCAPITVAVWYSVGGGPLHYLVIVFVASLQSDLCIWVQQWGHTSEVHDHYIIPNCVQSKPGTNSCNRFRTWSNFNGCSRRAFHSSGNNPISNLYVIICETLSPNVAPVTSSRMINRANENPLHTAQIIITYIL